MSETTQMLVVGGVFLVLLVGGMWIPFAIAVTAALYIFMASGWAGFDGLGLVSWGSTYSFSLTAIPLFILMATYSKDGKTYGWQFRIPSQKKRTARRLLGVNVER